MISCPLHHHPKKQEQASCPASQVRERAQVDAESTLEGDSSKKDIAVSQNFANLQDLSHMRPQITY